MYNLSISLGRAHPQSPLSRHTQSPILRSRSTHCTSPILRVMRHIRFPTSWKVLSIAVVYLISGVIGRRTFTWKKFPSAWSWSDKFARTMSSVGSCSSFPVHHFCARISAIHFPPSKARGWLSFSSPPSHCWKSRAVSHAPSVRWPR